MLRSNPNYDKEYYQKNKEKIKQRVRLYARKNRDKIKAYRSSEEYRAKDRAKKKQKRMLDPEKAHAYRREYYHANKEYIRYWVLKRTYNLSAEDYKALLEKQKGLCAICEGPQVEHLKNLSVDHDHATGKVRGLLCSKCNLLIGYANDTVAVLDKAIQYLNRSQEN